MTPEDLHQVDRMIREQIRDHEIRVGLWSGALGALVIACLLWLISLAM